jgi:hypothetical protein
MNKRKKNRKGQTKYNRQWIREHRAYMVKRFSGEPDKMTGRTIS